MIDKPSFISPYVESIFIKILSLPITIGGVYRPPSNSHTINDFLLEFKDKILNKLPTGNTIICGVFNINILNNAAPQITNFTTEMASYGFTNLIDKPTRVQINPQGNILSSTLIDHIWAACPEVDSAFIINHHITDHFPIGCAITTPAMNDFQQKIIRKINRTELALFQQTFLDYFNKVNINVDTNTIFCNVFDSLRIMTSEYSPIESVPIKIKTLKRPWINKPIKSLIDKKHLIYRKCRLNVLPFHRYRTYKTMLDKTIKLSKKCYYEDKFKNLKGKPRDTWRLINSVSNPCKTNKDNLVKENGMIIDDQKMLCDKFLDFFSSISTNSQNSNIPRTYIQANNNNFFLFPVTYQEVFTTLYSMKNNSLLANLPIRLLKSLGEPFCIFLTRLFNKAISTNTFPDELKLGTITPIPKGNSKDLRQHRGITILNPPSKILDKLLYKRLYNYFDKHKLFSKFQFGFLRKKGTEQAAMNLMYHINTALQNDETCIAVFIDLTKAFDLVDHKILEHKLHKYGIRGNALEFFHSYLVNRRIRVRINETYSDIRVLNSGVAQGSNLGPLLFNIFINDIHEVVKDCVIIIYADDIVILKSSKNISNLKLSLESDLANIQDYISELNQSVNLTKTKAMIFTRKKNINIDINFSNQPIEIVNQFKYLGLIIDEKLTFKPHIEYIKNKINQGNGKIYYLSKFLSIDILKKVFYSIIYSHLNLHILIWGGSTDSALNPLITSVNKTIRNI